MPLWPLLYKVAALALWVAGVGGLVALIEGRALRESPRYRRALALSLAACFAILSALGLAFP